MGQKLIWAALVFLGAFTLVTFQNCSGYQAAKFASAQSASSLGLSAPNEIWTSAFSLKSGETKAAGALALELTTTGLARLTNNGTQIWTASATTQNCQSQSCSLTFADDGSLTLSVNGQTSWTNGSSGGTGRQLRLLDSPPYLQITNADKTVVWYPHVPLVFFSALDNYVDYGGGRNGVSDFDQLFSNEAAYSSSLKRINVMQFYAAFLQTAPDSELITIFNFLKSHKIALAMEIGLLKEGTDGCGGGMEGYVGTGIPLTITQRIQSLGGELRYISIDESFSATQNPAGCKADVVTAAAQVTTKFKSLQAVFPGLLLGDTENLGTVVNYDYLNLYKSWGQALNAGLSAPLAYFHHDVDWNNQDWQSAQNVNRAWLTSMGLPYGTIFNGKAGMTSDATWAASARANIDFFRARFPDPDDLVFQNWDIYPSHALPETDQTTQTSVMAYWYSKK